MASSQADRLYMLMKQGRPLPRFSDDDVLDYIVAETVILRGLQAEAKAERERKLADWKSKPVGSGTPERSM